MCALRLQALEDGDRWPARVGLPSGLHAADPGGLLRRWPPPYPRGRAHRDHQPPGPDRGAKQRPRVRSSLDAGGGELRGPATTCDLVAGRDRGAVPEPAARPGGHLSELQHGDRTRPERSSAYRQVATRYALTIASTIIFHNRAYASARIEA